MLASHSLAGPKGRDTLAQPIGLGILRAKRTRGLKGRHTLSGPSSRCERIYLVRSDANTCTYPAAQGAAIAQNRFLGGDKEMSTRFDKPSK